MTVVRVYGHVGDYLTLDKVALCSDDACSSRYEAASGLVRLLTARMSSEYPGWPASTCLDLYRTAGCSTDYPGPYGQEYFEMTMVSWSGVRGLEITNYDSSQWQAASVNIILNRRRVFHQLDVSDSGRTVVVAIPQVPRV